MSENLALNRPVEVMARIPALGAGAYWLEITTQYSHGTLLKAPRTIQSGNELTVS